MKLFFNFTYSYGFTLEVWPEGNGDRIMQLPIEEQNIRDLISWYENVTTEDIRE